MSLEAARCHPGISRSEISGTQGRGAFVAPRVPARARACPGPRAGALGRDDNWRRGSVAALLLIIFIALIAPAWAVLPDEILKDHALEARARHISQELRCLVCQNQSIDDSNAELARDLRILVRERLSAGDSDDEVLAFVEKRYGEFVLLRPRFVLHTLLLWLAPPLLLLGAAGRPHPARQVAGRLEGCCGGDHAAHLGRAGAAR